MNLSVKGLPNPNFMRKYYLIAELLIFKHRRQNVSVSNTALLTAVICLEVTLSCENHSRDRWWCRLLSLWAVWGMPTCSSLIKGTKVNGQYYRDVLLHQQMLPPISDLSGDFFTFQQGNLPTGRVRLSAVNLRNTVRGAGGRKCLNGVHGRSPGMGSGDKVPQKLKHFSLNYMILWRFRSRDIALLVQNSVKI